MSAIHDEASFKTALDGLTLTQQRLVAARFVARVVDLSDDFRVTQGLACAANGGSSERELADAYRAARGAEVETYTSCGRHVDWEAMAAHYVAAAVAACVTPAQVTMAGVDNLALKAAMSARMARNCKALAEGHDGECVEVAEQYGLLQAFLQEQS